MYSPQSKFYINYILFALIAFLGLGAVGYAYYAQYKHFVEPCPLCVVERLCFIGTGLVALIAFVQHAKGWGNRIYGIIIALIAGFGIKISYHHVWLQSLSPDQWPSSCGMPLSILYKRIPLTGFIKTILSGSAECAMVNWKIFGIPAPKLCLAGFIITLLLALVIIFYRKPKIDYIV